MTIDATVSDSNQSALFRLDNFQIDSMSPPEVENVLISGPADDRRRDRRHQQRLAAGSAVSEQRVGPGSLNGWCDTDRDGELR